MVTPPHLACEFDGVSHMGEWAEKRPTKSWPFSPCVIEELGHIMNKANPKRPFEFFEIKVNQSFRVLLDNISSFVDSWNYLS